MIKADSGGPLIFIDNNDGPILIGVITSLLKNKAQNIIRIKHTKVVKFSGWIAVTKFKLLNAESMRKLSIA